MARKARFASTPGNAIEFSNADHTWVQRRERDDMFQKEIGEFVGAILEDRERLA